LNLRAYGYHDPEVGRRERYVICAEKRTNINPMLEILLIYHRQVTKDGRSYASSRFVKIWMSL